MMKIVGLDRFRKSLLALEKKIRNKVTKAGVKAALKPVIQAVKQEVPADTGSLKKSIGEKSKSYRGGTVQTAMVGARVGFKREIIRTVSKRGKQKIKTKRTKLGATKRREVRDPAKYLHLAEGGRKAVKAQGGKLVFRGAGGKIVAVRSVKKAQGRRFMRTAWRASKRTAFQAMMTAMQSAMESAIKEAAS